MDMEMQAVEEPHAAEGLHTTGELQAQVERLSAAAQRLQETADRLAGREMDLEASWGRVTSREAELESRLRDAEATIQSLRAASASTSASAPAAHGGERKTVPAGVTVMLAKQGLALDGLEAGSVDAALVSLPVEQRIAIKAQLLRAGLLG